VLGRCRTRGSKAWPYGVRIGWCPEVELVLVYRVRIILMERFNQFAPYHHIAFTHALPKHAEVKPFERCIIIKTVTVTLECVSQYKPIFGVDHTIAVPVNIMHIAGFQVGSPDADRQGGSFNFFHTLEVPGGFISVIRVEW